MAKIILDTGTAPGSSTCGTVYVYAKTDDTLALKNSAGTETVFGAGSSGTAYTFQSPLVNTSGTVSIPTAASGVSGYLAAADWTTFNNKAPTTEASSGVTGLLKGSDWTTFNNKLSGASSPLDNELVRFDGTTGSLIQRSPNVFVTDSGTVGIGTSTLGTDAYLTVYGANQVSRFQSTFSHSIIENKNTAGIWQFLTLGTSGKFWLYDSQNSRLAMEINTSPVANAVMINGTGVGVGATCTAYKFEVSSGDAAVVTAGKTFRVKEGTNACMGTATLVAGTVTVSTTAVTANSRIFLTIQSNGGTVGAVYVSARSAGTSFTITSTSGSDTSTVAWLLVEPA